MKNKIIATDKTIKTIIKQEIEKYGLNADLNHIDVSNVTDMHSMFENSKFNGDISKWDVSNVTNMHSMFFKSKFNGDISQWDVSNVTNMSSMFFESKFNGDISQWDVSNVTNMHNIFLNTPLADRIQNDKIDKLPIPAKLLNCILLFNTKTFANLKV